MAQEETTAPLFLYIASNKCQSTTKMNALRPSLRSTMNRGVRTRHQTCNKRSMGGGGGPPQESQSMHARLWEGHSTKPEGWETTIYATYAATAVVLTLALGFAPDTSINTWASNEAQVRLDLLKEGKIDKVEFGVHYNTADKVYDFDSKIVDNPFNEDDDDDDDDDEDDEEEEEEEE